MEKLPTIRLRNVKPEDYIEAVCIINRMRQFTKLPDTIGEYKGTIASTNTGDWFVWKTKTGYTIQKAYNK